MPIPHIHFIPSQTIPHPAAHLAEYKHLWSTCGSDVIAALEHTSRLHFAEPELLVLLVNDSSHSGSRNVPAMKLRYNYSKDVKLGTLMHELGHRLLFQLRANHPALTEHQKLYLFLLDAWVHIKGPAFHDVMVSVESQRSERYSSDIKWATRLTETARTALLHSLIDIEKQLTASKDIH